MLFFSFVDMPSSFLTMFPQLQHLIPLVYIVASLSDLLDFSALLKKSVLTGLFDSHVNKESVSRRTKKESAGVVM